ncbi:MAG TPA: hypothetical protein GX726_04495 [Clostridiales bacterium]|nr:hypothetical protein [Clostridiales bacterium]
MRKDEIKLEYLDTGEGNKFFIDDTVGKNHNLPFTFGIAEVHPSVGIDFDYEGDGAICLNLEGTIRLEDPATNETMLFEKGDVIYIPQAEGKHIIWSADVYSKFAFVTYPHWR